MDASPTGRLIEEVVRREVELRRRVDDAARAVICALDFHEIAVPAHNPETSLRRFDGAALWPQLSPEQQAAFGAAALELAIARHGMDVARDMREEHLFEAAEQAAGAVIENLATKHVLETGLVSHDEVPGIPSLLGPVCRQCGCTEHDACWTPPWGEGCSWVEPDLCSACAAGSGVRPRTAPAPEDSP